VRRKSSRKKASGIPFWRQPVVWGLLLAAVAFVVMVKYGRLPAPVVTTPDTLPSEELRLDDLREDLYTLFADIGVQPEEISQQRSEGMIDLVVDDSFPAPEALQDFRRQIDTYPAGLRFERFSPNRELRVFAGPELVVRIRFAEILSSGPVVTIIMDDIGRSLSKVSQLLEMEQPVTLAILPSTTFAAESASRAHEAGREVMVHIPMEPQGYPATEPGSDALLLEHSGEEVVRRLEDMFRRVPYAVGGNNHMGSRYTEYAEGMAVVGEYMKGKGLFFVDSRTTGNTIAAETMQDIRVPVISRNVFLDNHQDVEKIRQEIRRLGAMAKRNGAAVGICHPYTETLEALRLELPQQKKDGVRFVTVAEMIALNQSRGN
jgi:polysaccharide deacetylase 2 family uncharacterized protein YibQ